MRHPFHIGLRHTKKIAAFFGALLLIGVAGIFRVEWVEDITALLPHHDNSLIRLSRKLGMMRSVAVVLRSGEASDPSLHSAVDRVTDALRDMAGVAEVLGRVDPSEIMKSAQVLMSQGPRLYRPETPMDETIARSRVAALKERLAAPEGMMMGAYLLKDPFGLSFEALDGLSSVGKAMGQVVERGHVLSADRRAALVMVEVDFDPMDVARSARFVSEMDALLETELRELGGIDWTALGGVHHAALTATHLKRDISFTFCLTGALVLVIFGLFFGRVRALPVALLPAGIGIFTTLGLFGLFNIPLHALTLGFAATITGISIDYVIHLVHRAEAEIGDRRKQRMALALDRVGRLIVLGSVTTLGAFLLIAFSGFTGIRQLALFSVSSLLIALFASLFLVSGMYRFILRPRSPRARKAPLASRAMARFYSLGGSAKPGWVIAVFSAVLLAMVYLSMDIRLSGDPRDLGHRSDSIAAREAIVKTAFTGIFDHVMVVSSARSMEEALQKNDALFDALLDNGVAKDRIVTLSPFLPSRRRQTEGLESFREKVPKKSAVRILSDAGFEADYGEQVLDIGSRAITPALYRGTGLSTLIDKGVCEIGDEVHVVTRVAGGDEALLALLTRISNEVGVKVVSERLEIAATLHQLQRELVWMLTLWLAVALSVLSVVQRSVRFGLFAALPALFGVAAAVGLFAGLGRPLTPVASAGMTLVMGLGIDYGIFMQQQERYLEETAAAVGASALTTLAAFGVLAISDIRAMADIGLIILSGLLAALVTALLLVPACRRVFRLERG